MSDRLIGMVLLGGLYALVAATYGWKYALGSLVGTLALIGACTLFGDSGGPPKI
jgi:hypothetical protein